MAGFFDTLFGGGAEREAADKDRAALAQYQTQAGDILGSTYNQGRTDLGSAIGAYTPLANLGATYSSGVPTLMGALGISHPARDVEPGAGCQGGQCGQREPGHDHEPETRRLSPAPLPPALGQAAVADSLQTAIGQVPAQNRLNRRRQCSKALVVEISFTDKLCFEIGLHSQHPASRVDDRREAS